MSDTHLWAQRFVQALADSTVDAWFDGWTQSEDEHCSYQKIATGGQEVVPKQPGLYLWGASRTVDNQPRVVPRYVGRAKSTLQERFLSRNGRWSGGKGRYLLAPGVAPGDTPPQGWLASRFHGEIREAVGSTSNTWYAKTLKPLDKSQSPAMHGLEAFPPELIASFKGSTLRLRHAVDWALHGGPNLVHLWAAFLPEVEHLEEELRSAATRWRRAHGLPPLLNKQDREP